MTEKDKRMELPKMSLDDLFTIQGERDAKETIVAIPINEIDDFPNHPYKVKDDDKMLEMSENIKRYGVTQPVIVRQKDDGRFEMISGHRRKRASILAGKENINAIVKKLTDEEAIQIINDILKREKINKISNCSLTEKNKILKECLEIRGISIRQIARILQIDRKQIKKIIK